MNINHSTVAAYRPVGAMKKPVQQPVLAKPISFSAHQKQDVDLSTYKENLMTFFKQLVQIDSTSLKPNDVEEIPSTKGQIEVLNVLLDKTKSMGLVNAKMDDTYKFVTADLPSNITSVPVSEQPTIGLVTHVDTSPMNPGKDIHPTEHVYTGGDLDIGNGVTIPAADLKGQEGNTLITSDGTTLLGADDKAGITAALYAVQYLQDHPEIKHPPIRLVFSPDEENVAFANKADLTKLGIDIGYTIDCEEPEKIGVANANGIAIKLNAAYKGDSKNYKEHSGEYISTLGKAFKFLNSLPSVDPLKQLSTVDENVHVAGVIKDTTKLDLFQRASKGTITVVDSTVQQCRSIAMDMLNSVKEKMSEMGFDVNNDADNSNPMKLLIEAEEVYQNMNEKIKTVPELTTFAEKGIQESGLSPMQYFQPGISEGSYYAQQGIPLANLGDGDHNFHRKTEFLSVPELYKSVEVVIRTLGNWGEAVESGDVNKSQIENEKNTFKSDKWAISNMKEEDKEPFSILKQMFTSSPEDYDMPEKAQIPSADKFMDAAADLMKSAQPSPTADKPPIESLVNLPDGLPPVDDYMSIAEELLREAQNKQQGP